MGLDYSKGCVNFRDVGEFINLIAGNKLLPEKLVFRGGKLDSVASLEEIGNPRTVINLRKSPDITSLEIQSLHFPISNNYEKYETKDKTVHRWLVSVISTFANPSLKYPVLIHCTSGKDRTGVVVAALLYILRIPKNIIVAEYLLSDGEVRSEWIQQSLDGIGNLEIYFGKPVVEAIYASILG